MRRTSCAALIVVGGILAGLLALGIRRVQHAAAITQCANNLKQIGLAMQNYHSFQRRFPSAVYARSKLPEEERLSWMLEIYAFVESNMDPLWRTDPELPWDAEKNRYVTDSRMPVYCCPSNAELSKTNWTSYVGVAGLGRDAIELPLGDPKAGLFGYRRTVTLDDVRDGVSTTICVAETNRELGPWAKPGYTTARGLDSQTGDYLGVTGQFGSFHRDSTGFIWGRSTTMVLFVDASVRRLSEATDPRVIEALVTIAGGEKVADDL